VNSIVLASHNPGKVREIQELLEPFGLNVCSASQLHLEEPEETEPTFEGNALIKARAAAKASGLPSIADDSGFCVDALGGDPGIYSARWAGPDKNFLTAMQKVWAKMNERDVQQSCARFVCVLAVCDQRGNEHVFRGEALGNVVWPPRGNNGFGYDPMFIPQGGQLTYGEMDPQVKHAQSHRAKAFSLLIQSGLLDHLHSS